MAKIRGSRWFLVLGLLLLRAVHARSETLPTEINRTFRHIVILQADLENIWGHYYFAVNNPNSEPQKFRSALLLPHEAVDFQPQSGLEASELHLDAAGKLYVDKVFPSGLSLLGVGFQVKANSLGSDTLSFTLPFEIEELTFAVPLSSGLELASPGFREGLPPMLATGQYKGVRSVKPLASQQEVKVSLTGIPKVRAQFWQVGALVAGLFILCGLFFAFKTRPLAPDSGEASAEDVFNL